jgi:hypothetical protein
MPGLSKRPMNWFYSRKTNELVLQLKESNELYLSIHPLAKNILWWGYLVIRPVWAEELPFDIY